MRPWCLLAGLLAALAPAAAWAEAEPDNTDWPTVISRLQHTAYERPGTASVREQLALAYNNYGVSLGNQRQWGLAAQQLQEALRLEGNNAQFQSNLANIYLNQAYEAYQQHQLVQALGAVDEAVKLNPNLASGFALLGEIQYARQQLKEAKGSWERALELDPSMVEIRPRLARVREELPIESKFERLSQAYFDLRYEEELERPAGFDVRDALLNARRHVGSDFSYWPKYKIVVLIYSAEQFHALREETPDWVAGQFDGKIRVPLPSAQLNPAMVTQILFHEYTHALIHDLAKDRCPAWLNEGLAEYEGRSQLRGTLPRLRAAFKENALIPWPEVSEHITSMRDAEEVGLAYEQSYSLVAYLLERYAFWRIRRILKAIGEGVPWEDALAVEVRTKRPRLEAQWRAWLPEFLARQP